jgi:hypothetical protein
MIWSIEFDQVKPMLLLSLCFSEKNQLTATQKAHTEEQWFFSDNEIE